MSLPSSWMWSVLPWKCDVVLLAHDIRVPQLHLYPTAKVTGFKNKIKFHVENGIGCSYLLLHITFLHTRKHGARTWPELPAVASLWSAKSLLCGWRANGLMAAILPNAPFHISVRCKDSWNASVFNNFSGSRTDPWNAALYSCMPLMCCRNSCTCVEMNCTNCATSGKCL